MEQSFFKDRRNKDRRLKHQPLDSKPVSGCRRNNNRRNCAAATDPKPWWLKVGYSEEVSAAVVRSNQRPKLYKNRETDDDQRRQNNT